MPQRPTQIFKTKLKETEKIGLVSEILYYSEQIIMYVYFLYLHRTLKKSISKQQKE